MAYTVEEVERDAMRDLLEDVLRDPKHLKTFLDRLVEEDRLRELAPEKRLRGLALEERLEGLDPALIEAWLKQQRRHDH
ncbi:hypothetical protein [uncultured Lamprocystis sp.]|uniref:hypothetical protein n=1 Tax=uncultured Lamprocystis sp. TaxID=543132 RepID=UPI0025F6627F|nr:hypothetical protein [uncultured Lamprocystis sp.]